MTMKGIRLDGKKEATLVTWTIKRPVPPAKITVPLDFNHSQCFRVKPGDQVRVGQPLTSPDHELVACHAGIAGKVEAIGPVQHPLLGDYPAVTIAASQKQESDPSIGRERPRWQTLLAGEYLSIFKEAGVLNMDEEGRLMTGESSPAVLINACESEPYLTSDHALMMSHPMEILQGAEILRKVKQAKRFLIVIEDNKREVAELLKSKIYFLKWDYAEVQMVPTSHPRGAKSVLAGDFLNGQKNSEDSIFNVATAFAVYEAVALQKPLYERAVTVGGECLVEPKNLWLPVGISYQDAFQCARGFLRKPEKIVLNGPMTGRAVETTALPVLKSTSGILALSRETAVSPEAEPCIRCGWCLDVCPADISPVMITLAAEEGRFDLASRWGVRECIECGNCSYICPSKRPMVELLREAKSRDKESLRKDRQNPMNKKPRNFYLEPAEFI